MGQAPIAPDIAPRSKSASPGKARAATAAADGAPVVAIEGLIYAWPGKPVLLDIPELKIAAREKLFLRGPSGSGKSTLLGLLGGVLQPQKGSVKLLGQELTAMSNAQRDAFRAEHIGLVFQMFNLLPFLSLIENVTLPCRFSLRRRKALPHGQDSLNEEARRLLRQLGLPENAVDQPVRDLSVGQQQRVAAARALIGGPEILIADEPTSALDADTRGAFLKLLMDQCEKHATTLIFVSHDNSLGRYFDRAIDLGDINRREQNRRPG